MHNEFGYLWISLFRIIHLNENVLVIIVLKQVGLVFYDP
jgi:hypothetical protein